MYFKYILVYLLFTKDHMNISSQGQLTSYVLFLYYGVCVANGEFSQPNKVIRTSSEAEGFCIILKRLILR